MNSFFIIWNVYFICAKVLKWFEKLYRFRLTLLMPILHSYHFISNLSLLRLFWCRQCWLWYYEIIILYKMHVWIKHIHVVWRIIFSQSLQSFFRNSCEIIQLYIVYCFKSVYFTLLFLLLCNMYMCGHTIVWYS